MPGVLDYRGSTQIISPCQPLLGVQGRSGQANTADTLALGEVLWWRPIYLLAFAESDIVHLFLLLLFVVYSLLPDVIFLSLPHFAVSRESLFFCTSQFYKEVKKQYIQ